MTQIIRITPEETLDKELSEWYDSYHPEYSIKPRERTYYCVFEKWSPDFYKIETEIPPVFRLPRGGVHATSFSFC